MANKLHPVNLNKSRFCILAMLWVFGILLAACQPDIQSVEPTPNPNPKEIYEITVTVENAPGEFTSAEAVAAYQAGPRECLPPASPLSMTGSSGVTSGREEMLATKQLSSTSFTSRAVFDAYNPSNDYGFGVCAWKLQSVSVRLYNGINEHYVSMSSTALQQESSIKEAMQRNRFDMKASPESGLKWHTNSGREITKENESEYPSDKYFYVLINSKKVMP